LSLEYRWDTGVLPAADNCMKKKGLRHTESHELKEHKTGKIPPRRNHENITRKEMQVKARGDVTNESFLCPQNLNGIRINRN
jgi:hypothetical protein